LPLFRELPRSLSGVSPGDHICCIFESARDRLAALVPFIGQGLDRNERVLCFFEAGGESDVFEGLRSIGIDPAPFLDRGQLSIVAPGKSPPPIPPEIALAERGGWAGLRTAADTGWILASESPARCMGTFENDLGQAGRSMQPPTSLCLYDSRRFTPTLLLKALSAHPKALLGAHAAENIYHLPPEELRDEDTAGQTLRCWLKNLREHRLTHDALQNSERNYALLFNKMLNGFALMEAVCDESGVPVDLRYLEVNPAFERQSGLLAHEVIGRTLGELGAFDAAPEDTTAWVRLIGGVAIDGKPVRYEKSGEFHDRWIEGFAFSPRFGQVAIMFQDVSDRKKVERELERYRELLEEMVAERTSDLEASLREKELLLREIHHRVKNNLQVIASLLSLQEGVVADPAAATALAESRTRIATIGLVHERFYNSSDLSRIDLADYARKLFLSLVQTYGIDSNRVRLQVWIEACSMDISVAIPWALILNELLVNALKHAWAAGGSGQITVSMKRDDDRWKLSVADDGRGLPEGFDIHAVTSLGLRIVRLLAEQIGGSVRARSGGGTEILVDFPESGIVPATAGGAEGAAE
jgi:two-component sensor histidine kinase/PAS domain-containing protein